MKQISRPLRLLLRGSILAKAMLFEGISEAVAQERVFALYQSGAEVWRTASGILLVWPEARRIRTPGPGLPLVFWRGWLCALDPQDLDPGYKEAPRLGILRFSGGMLQEELCTERLDPSRWILPKWIPLKALPIGPPPPQAESPAAPTVNLKAALPKMPEPDPKLKELLEAMATPKEVSYPGWAGGWLGSFLRNLLRPKPQKSLDEKILNLTQSASSLPAPDNPGWRENLAKLLEKTGLWGMILDRQARYMQELFEAFDQGRLEEALKRALPLGGQYQGPSFGIPGMRLDLKLNLGQGGGGATSIWLDRSLQDRLRDYYKRAAERLEKEGRIDEAVFVLEELLKLHLEAVALLERNNRLELAAELAEARRLNPELIVRLWMAAGNEARAIRVARISGCFQNAVAAMQSKNPVLASRLVKLWAESEVRRGNLSGAVDILWSDASLRQETVPLLEQLLAGSVPAAARAIPRLLSLKPDRAKELRPELLSILEATGEDGAMARLALGEGFNQHKPAGRGGISRGLARQLFLDTQSFGTPESVGRALYSDPLLSATMPRASFVPEMPFRKIESTLYADDRGSRPILDAVLLASGEMVVALGEAGFKILNARGATVFQDAMPLHRLIPTERGLVIGLTLRDSYIILQLVDPWRRTVKTLGEYTFRLWADSSDGDRLFVVEEGHLCALDLHESGRSLWRSGHLGQIQALNCRENLLGMTLLFEDQLGVELQKWSYEVPRMLLRARERVNMEAGAIQALPLLAEQSVVVAQSVGPVESSPDRMRLVLDDATWKEFVPGSMAASGVIGAQGNLLIVWEGQSVVGWRLSRVGSVKATQVFSMQWVGSRPKLRVRNEQVVAWDETGRLLAWKANGVLFRNFRL